MGSETQKKKKKGGEEGGGGGRRMIIIIIVILIFRNNSNFRKIVKFSFPTEKKYYKIQIEYYIALYDKWREKEYQKPLMNSIDGANKTNNQKITIF